MNLLIDESLQHDLARLLSQAGHNAVHVTDLGLRGASDEALLAQAAQDDRVMVTADTDFGTLLALTGASEPSVILLRRSGRRTTERIHIVLTVLALAGEHLERGAVVTVEHDRLRIRQLPIAR